MRHLALVFAVVALCALAHEARADDWSLENYLQQHGKSDWDGHGVGSMVHRKTVQDVSMPQLPAPQQTETEEKRTLVGVTDEGYVVKVERKFQGRWQASEETEPRSKGWESKIEDAGTGTVSVGGTDYECAKKKVTWTSGEEVEEQSTVWVHPEKGILKIEAGEEGSPFEMVVTKLAATWTVGDATIEGRELTMSVKAQLGPMQGTMRICPGLPGAIVRQEFAGQQGPAKVSVVTELVAYVKK